MGQIVKQRGFPHLPSAHQGNYFASTKVIFNQLLNCSVYHNAVVLRCKYTNFFEYNRQIYTNFLDYIRQIYTDFGGLRAIIKPRPPNEEIIKGCPIRTPLDCLRSLIAQRNPQREDPPLAGYSSSAAASS
jgi:hypothetical protein